MIALRELSEQAGTGEALAFESGGGGAEEIRFRDYRLLPSSRILLKGRALVAIGSRAFDILIVLLQARGCIVGKREIVKAVWPTTIVEESNLRFQVAQLRKALGDDQDLIKTIPGRGYLFALEAQPMSSAGPPNDVVVLEVNAGREAMSVPQVQFRPDPKDQPSPARGRMCAEARVLLQRFVHSLKLERGAVIVYVQLGE
ncbi:MAG TPA: winged helix-turn-helix domain-containing protein [Microvirga sp.]|nr:winged helix-turn-helix domain-containing protein [Microvirga sp.]